MYARDIMNVHVVSVNPEMELKELIKILLDKNIDGTPVVDKQGRVIGIVTDVDLISLEMNSPVPSLKSILQGFVSTSASKKGSAKEQKNKIYKVKDIMITDVITVEDCATLHEIIEVFVEQKVSRIPVVSKDEKLIGIISRSDIMRYMQSTMI